MRKYGNLFDAFGSLGYANGFRKGLSRVLGNPHARFLGGWRLVTVAAYPIRIPCSPRAELDDDSRIEVDAVVVGIGVEPDVKLAQTTGIDVDNGIVVDESGRSSDARIFAAGDCSCFPFEKVPTRLESVQNAIDQAEHVAEAMLGVDAPYVPVPWFWSDQYSTKLQIAGLNRGYDRVVVRPSVRKGGLSVWYFDEDDRLLAVDAIDDGRAYMMGKRWIAAGLSPDRERLADPSMDLKSLCG